MLVLKDAEVVASGSSRNVYRHPRDPSLLVKVIRPAAIEERFGSGAPWFKSRRRRYRHLISFLRELREQIAVHALGDGHPPFLQKIVGIVETDLGMGVVVEAVLGRDGDFAPSVAGLIYRGQFDQPTRSKLDRFLEDLVASPVIVSDLHPSNVVLGYTPERGEQFVLIDGIGFKNLIPLNRMSPHINRWGKARKAGQFRAAVEALAAEMGIPRQASPATA
ncbi:MAG: YrbL family protein [Hyphomicrobiaceae bacterium]